MFVNLVNRTVEVFDCGGKKNNKAVEAFAILIPRIVKAVQSSDKKKDFNVKQYAVSYVPMRALNTSGNDCGITKFEERVMEKVKSEMVRVEHQMSEKLKEKVDLEIARVAHEMKHKLKIATVAMVVVGAIVGIWTSLSV
ncbi:hypothetical protein F2Q69_00043499 [Brassica cretica]|uniref:Ubiquitin-like protease family profile domain-containing protein n=1 Tax=Brassica cretica TaxID=69181 RepID=A0A8S9NHH6_BRACR|nr:hypothetical protein F2Q69_00043499 [Brassica cretica]